MPQIVRSMKEDGKPQLGQESSTLGVRPGTDVTPQANGMVLPHTGGMSVAPSLGAMRKFLIPSRLRGIIREADGATGKNNLRVWKRGMGTFEDAPLTGKLTLRLDKPTHGMVEPNAVMSFAEYETALQDTRDDWTIDEGGVPV